MTCFVSIYFFKKILQCKTEVKMRSDDKNDDSDKSYKSYFIWEYYQIKKHSYFSSVPKTQLKKTGIFKIIF